MPKLNLCQNPIRPLVPFYILQPKLFLESIMAPMALRITFILTALSCATANVFCQVPACIENHRVKVGETLETIAAKQYRNEGYAIAIWLATNVRYGIEDFTYIPDPRKLSNGAVVCIPQQAEAEHFLERFKRYTEAISETSSEGTETEAHNLRVLQPSQSIRFLTWISSDDLSNLANFPHHG